MKWEFIAQREMDFLKNCLVYESFVENFKKVIGIDHPDFLTIREGMSYTHYLNRESHAKLAKHLLKKLQKDPIYFKEMFEEGKEKFDELVKFASSLKEKNKKTNAQLMNIIRKYFMMYKAPYPYFLINTDARVFEENKSKYAQEAIEIMAKLRLYGRTSFNKTHELAAPLFEEIAKKLNINIDELKFLKPYEIETLLDGGFIDVKQCVKDRQSCFFLHSNGRFALTENAKLTIKDVEYSTNSEIDLVGQGTYPSIYKGKVRIIQSSEDLKNLKEGEILVAKMTTTDLITSQLEKAGAIITDEGGITCHAAIISREMKKPCIIGTRIATKVLKTGDMVEVDATNGVVKKLDKPLKR